jgi:hypothetical protein
MSFINYDLFQTHFKKRAINTKWIDLNQGKYLIYKFDMNSMNYIRGLHYKTPIGEFAMDMFLGIALSELPKMEIVGMGTDKLDDAIKEVFYDHYIPFIKDWWINSHTTAMTWYMHNWSEEHEMWITEKVDLTRGQAYCLYDPSDSANRHYIWSWLDDTKNTYLATDKFDKVRYDPGVGCIITDHPDLIDDNIMRHVSYIENIKYNKQAYPPGLLRNPYKGRVANLLTEFWRMDVLKHAELTTELEKTNVDVIWKTVVPWKTDEYNNWLQTFGGEHKNVKSLQDSLQYQKHYNLNHKKPQVNQFANQTTSSTTVAFSNDFLSGNPEDYDITDLPTLYGGAPRTTSDILYAQERATISGIGISSQAVRNGNITSIYGGPTQDPVFLPKQTSKSITEQEESFKAELYLAYSQTNMAMSGGKAAAETVRLFFTYGKYRYMSLIRSCENALNCIWNKLLENYADDIRGFLRKIYGNSSITNDYLRVKFHLQPNFDVSVDDLLKVHQAGILDSQFVQNCLMRQWGLSQVVTTAPSDKKEQKELERFEQSIPDRPLNLPLLMQKQMEASIEASSENGESKKRKSTDKRDELESKKQKKDSNKRKRSDDSTESKKQKKDPKEKKSQKMDRDTEKEDQTSLENK